MGGALHACAGIGAAAGLELGIPGPASSLLFSSTVHHMHVQLKATDWRKAGQEEGGRRHPSAPEDTVGRLQRLLELASPRGDEQHIREENISTEKNASQL